jgi:hypothetical protein
MAIWIRNRDVVARCIPFSYCIFVKRYAGRSGDTSESTSIKGPTVRKTSTLDLVAEDTVPGSRMSDPG